ncbi:uncharacterized protein [Aegilops tauschii subsp. strangulata]|uniref:uncharacterized protein n=1 Tax=Aegilops tauschii subsp. strangulata TaxID=200361 RepID=UPI003CC8B345
MVVDITFCNGHLYCFRSVTNVIVKFEASLEYGVLMFRLQRLYMQNVIEHLYLGGEYDPEAHAVYILELRGKLVVATRRPGGRRSWSSNTHGSSFMVFELVYADTEGTVARHMYNWEEVTSLGDYALFLGPGCAKAIHVSTGERDGLRRNHIYYSHHICYKQKELVPDNAQEFLTSSSNDDCRVYYKEDEIVDNDVEGITLVGYYVLGGGHPPTWMFPPDL